MYGLSRNFRSCEKAVWEDILATINRKHIFLGRVQIFPREGTNFLSNGGGRGVFYDVVKFRISRLAERYSVTGVTVKSVGWESSVNALLYI